MPSIAYRLLTTLCSAANKSANFPLEWVLPALKDGTLKVDFSEENEQGVPLAWKMIDDASSGYIMEFSDTDESPEDEQDVGPSRRSQLDDLAAFILRQPSADPWSFAPDNSLTVISGLVHFDMPLALDALLSHPRCPSAKELEAQWHQIDPRSLDQRTHTKWPFHQAAYQDVSSKVVKRLAQHGFDPNLPDNTQRFGWFPLADARSSSMVQALVEVGADPWRANLAGNPLPIAWSSRGITASYQASMAKALRETAARVNADDPREALSLARSATGYRALQSSMARHGLNLASTDASGISIADYALLGLLTIPSRTASETAKNETIFKSITQKLKEDPSEFDEATHQRASLCAIRFAKFAPASEDAAASLIERLDQDVEAGLIDSGSRASVLLLDALAKSGAGVSVPFPIMLVERMSRAGNEEGPWSIGEVVETGYTCDKDKSRACLRLQNEVDQWVSMGLAKDRVRDLVAMAAADPGVDDAVALHALLPWISDIACSRDRNYGQANKYGLMPNHLIQNAFSEVLDRGGVIDGSLPGASWRLEVASRRSSNGSRPEPALLAMLDYAKMSVATPSSPSASRPRLPRL